MYRPWSLLVTGLTIVLSGCGAEARTAPHTTVVVAVDGRDGASSSARCASAVRRVAAEAFDCDEDDIETHPVGPGAFLTSGCGGERTWFCDPAGGRPRW